MLRLLPARRLCRALPLSAAVQMSEDHVPDNENERRRIESKNPNPKARARSLPASLRTTPRAPHTLPPLRTPARVIFDPGRPSFLPLRPRSSSPSFPLNPPRRPSLPPNLPQKPLVRFVGSTWRVGGLLALSRAFGDAYLKPTGEFEGFGSINADYSSGFGVEATPFVVIEDIGPDDTYLVLSSDGLYSNEERGGGGGLQIDDVAAMARRLPPLCPRPLLWRLRPQVVAGRHHWGARKRNRTRAQAQAIARWEMMRVRRSAGADVPCAVSCLPLLRSGARRERHKRRREAARRRGGALPLGSPARPALLTCHGPAVLPPRCWLDVLGVFRARSAGEARFHRRRDRPGHPAVNI